MAIDIESIKNSIPSYLTASDQTELAAQLDALSRGKSTDYYLNSSRQEILDNLLQGDGWRGLTLIDFESGDRIPVRGIILSNSCDVSPENPRDIPTKLTFAPLVKLSKYRQLLEAHGVEASRIEAKLSAIRSQRTTSIFYLPAGGTLQEDYIVRFDDVYSMPTAVHLNDKSRERLFVLSMVGFYVFVLKLSVHFCRLQEKVSRSA